MYSFWLAEKDELQLPAEISFPVSVTQVVKKVSLLGIQQPLNFTMKDGVVKIKIPADVQQNRSLNYAAAFKLEY